MTRSLMQSAGGRVVALCYAICLVYWVVTAFFTKRTAEGEGWWGRWLSRTGLIALIALVAFGRRAGPVPREEILWPYSPLIGFAAATITVIGLWIVLWARTVLGRNWSANVVIKHDHELIQRGPYRYVRHPIYSGFILMVIGGVLLWGTTSALIVLVVLPVVLWLKLSAEERLMSKHFPDAYPAYKARVKALVPFLI